MTHHMVVQLAFEGKTCFADSALILAIIMDIVVQGVGTQSVKELFALLALKFSVFAFEVVIPFLASSPPKLTHQTLKQMRLPAFWFNFSLRTTFPEYVHFGNKGPLLCFFSWFVVTSHSFLFVKWFWDIFFFQ